MPLVGPSVDRRTLTMVCRLAKSETLHGLVCIACTQLLTRVNAWECMYKPCRSFESEASKSDIRMCRVGDTLLQLERDDLQAFLRNFSLDCVNFQLRTTLLSPTLPGTLKTPAKKTSSIQRHAKQ